jgi:hypothetical protein
MTKDEALKMAINTMEIWNGKNVKTNTASFMINFEGAINACKEALEQTAQEPVAWMSAGRILTDNKEQADWWIEAGGIATPLYTHSTPDSAPDSTPALSWQGLDMQEIGELSELAQESLIKDGLHKREYIFEFAYFIEQALRERNT